MEAAADAACAKPLVCTSGSAATVVLTLLNALAATGCRFAYHGDFDWPGIALVNRIIRRYETLPWRMGAEYCDTPRRCQPGGGCPSTAHRREPGRCGRGPGLAPAMNALGVALHEEATLDLLGLALRGPSPSTGQCGERCNPQTETTSFSTLRRTSSSPVCAASANCRRSSHFRYR